MKNKNQQTTDDNLSEKKITPKRGLTRKAAKVLLGASVIAGGATMYHKADQAADKAAKAGDYARTVETQLADARARSSEQHDELKKQLETQQTMAEAKAAVDASKQQKLERKLEIQENITSYLSGLSGVDSEQIVEHSAYPALPEVTGQFSAEIAKKQDDATLYLFKFDTAMSEVDESTVLGYGCTAVKTGDNTLSSVAHCFPEAQGLWPVDENTPAKGGGEYTPPEEHISPYLYFVSDQPTITLGEAWESAMQVTSFNKDYVNSDTAILGVSNWREEEEPEWFSKIEPLQAMNSVPAPGTFARVSGYPNGSSEPIAAEGIVLGQMPATFIGYHYPSELTIVGIDADVYDEYTCSFGGSGETMVNQEGEWFGNLAYIGRSDNPVGSIMVTPTPEQLIQMEEMFNTRLADKNYILCGFAPAIPDMQPLPLFSGTVDTAVSPEVYSK
jgi:hypothetical protein